MNWQKYRKSVQGEYNQLIMSVLIGGHFLYDK